MTLVTFSVAFALMQAVYLTGTLRVSLAGELEGLDVHEHGTAADPEYVVNGKDGTPKSVDEARRRDRGKGLASLGLRGRLNADLAYTQARGASFK